MFGILNIKGASLDKNQLEEYIEKFASDNVLGNEPNMDTYPIPKMMESFNFITKVYNLLNEHIKLKINIHPAGEWLLDNYYIIEENVKIIEKELTKSKYKNLISITNGNYKGYARIYVLAAEILAYTENNVNSTNLDLALRAYQKKKSLSMNEIWNIGIFLKIVLIQNIANICEKIYSSQIQKYRAESIVERLVETRKKDEQIYKNDVTYNTSKLGYGELKYPFIEHISYKLKKIGKKGKAFFDILENQVNKMGTVVSDVIQKEHFDIAIKKISMANSILTIKRLNRMNFVKLFENLNGVEEILKEDPLKIYENMDYSTKEIYRNKIQQISKKTKISEIYIAQTAIELATNAYNNNTSQNVGVGVLDDPQNQTKININKNDQRININEHDIKCHVGYYLISDGESELIKALNTGRKNKILHLSSHTKSKIYVGLIAIVSLIFTVLLNYKIYEKTNIICFSILSLFLYIPITEIVIQIVQYILGKIVKPKKLPKMDFSEGIPESCASFVVIPTIIGNKEKVKELMHKLEVYFLANKSENLYFALLGDCSSSKYEKDKLDNEVIEEGKRLVSKLNKKYPTQGFDRFHFLYRKRVWNKSEEAYLGWERKRGLLNQFNEYLLQKKDADFIVNTIDKNSLPQIKYVITLDADTDLSLNSAYELVGAMAHILNTPIIENKRVVKGHSIIQPKVGININASRKSLFTQIFAGSGGTDLYTNAIFDVYQDNFDEGIFTGKGIYNLEVFSEVLKDQIPENTVLSHDLLEGSYLRCGLASDILLMDGYPYKYNSFMSRLARWIRGDWQITQWMFRKIRIKNGQKVENPLNFLSRFKILDNLRRSLFEITALSAIVLSIFLKLKFNIKTGAIITVSFISIIIPMVMELLNIIIFRKEDKEHERTFTPNISGIKGIFLRAVLSISFAPHKAYVCLSAIVKTLYRKYISKKHLLEWTTSEEAEKNSKTDLNTYYKSMFINVVFAIVSGILAVYSNLLYEKIVYLVFAIIWFFAPGMACYISRQNKEKIKIYEVKKEDIEYIQSIGKSTWQYFKDTLNEKNNYLPPDNYQETRKKKFVDRTSSTNIGLGLLAVISSYDLKYENFDFTINLIEKMLNVINSLQKWNGHLYNWYNINNLEPLIPRYVSTVDSGNFVGYLYVVKQFLENSKNDENKDRLDYLIQIVDDLIQKTDFTKVYDYKTGLFSIGFNVEDNKLTDSYYDLLASEARQASLVAISKGDVKPKHWRNLSRTLTNLKGYKGLISWSGTAFEYLMPNINIPSYEGSLLDESCKFMIMSQIEYSRKVGIPWGISESAFNLKDLHSNYQYKAFGIPWLGLKRGLEDEMVVSSYGSMLWLAQNPNQVIENIKQMESQGIKGKYGLYEAIDYTRSRLAQGKNLEVVKTFMAHHQGLILLSINNLINNNILQKRFLQNPQIEAIDILLQERMLENVIITKEKKEKPSKIKYQDYENYSQTNFNKGDYKLDKYNVISNENYSIITNQKGEGYSKYKDILINRYKQTSDVNQGIFFYIKNVNTKRIWTANYMNYLDKPDKYNCSFSPDSTVINRFDGNIETTTKITIGIDKPIEIRQVILKNNGNQEEILEVSGSFEPIISEFNQDISHPAFNNLFLRYDMEDDNIILERRNREKNVEKVFLGISLYTEDETIGELEYEIDKEKFFGRGNINLPEMIKESKPFSKQLGLVTEPIVAMKKTIKIKPGQTVKLSLILSISNNKQETLDNLNEYKNQGIIDRNFELVKIKSAEEIRYLGIKAKDIEVYKNVMSLLIVQNNMKTLYMDKFKNKNFSQEDLWKFGISGDMPIIVAKISDLNDSYVIDEILKAYEYLRIKNICLELVILNEEDYSYNSYANEGIENCILNNQLAYLKNVKGGIFVINSKEISKQDLELLEFRANIIIDSHLGNLSTQIGDIEDDYINSIKNIGEELPERIVVEEENIRTNMFENKEVLDNFKYYNEYGAFSKDGKEYFIKINKDENLPTTWSHVIANKNFGTVVTDGMGGYTWNKNSRLNRLTAWNNNPSQDIPSEVIYLKDKETAKAWSIGARPMPDNNDYYITYGFGYAKYEHYCLGISQKLQVFVPRDESVKINILELKNTLPTSRKLKLIYYIKPVLGEDEIKSNGYIDVTKDSNIIYFQNMYSSDFKGQMGYISTSEPIKSYTGNKKSFIGTKNISKPEAIDKVSLDNCSGFGADSCVAIQLEIELKAFEEKKISILLGEDENILNIKDITYKYTNLSNCMEELEKVKVYWENKIDKLQVETPIESMNILLNGWCIYQSLASRIYARSGYYQSGGAFGFRDQLQDTLSMRYTHPEIVKEQILKHSRHQFIEGDVEHWWHEETGRGIRTRFSDDLLWLVYMCIEYIEVTGDESILDVQEPYVKGELLEDGVNEKYDKYEYTNSKESIFNHCIRAIEKSLDFGQNGLPKIGSGDWNDGMSEVGPQGIGESVWLGFFLYNILERFVEILKRRDKMLYGSRKSEVGGRKV